jgi:hypothetical protein
MFTQENYEKMKAVIDRRLTEYKAHQFTKSKKTL